MPGLVGAAYVFVALYPNILFFVWKMALIGGLVLVAFLTRRIGDADSIALIILVADPLPLSPIPTLLFASAFFVGHVLYEYGLGNFTRKEKVIPMERFLREQCWIPCAILIGGERTEVTSNVNLAREEAATHASPDALVQVAYGWPNVAYYGLGYASFLLYLVLFNLPTFLSLP